MNKNQKIILAIFIPIIFFFIALMIANSVGYTVKTRTLTGYLSKYEGKTYRYREGNPFDWERTWYIWLIFFTFCCIFEYKLFADKKNIND